MTNLKGILPTIFLYIIFLFIVIHGDCTIYTLIPFISAFSHEMGHIFAIKLFGIRIKKITFYPFGADIRIIGCAKNLRGDFFIAGAGIITNIILAIISFPFAENTAAAMFCASNFALAAINALPIITLDGGTMLTILLSRIFLPDTADRIMRPVSFVSIMILWTAAMYILLYTGFNFTLFAIAVYLFASIFLRERSYMAGHVKKSQ